MSAVLLDTGCIVALLDRSERHHGRCVDAVAAVRDPLVTCEGVIAESCYLLRSMKGAPELVIANVESGVFQIPFRLDQESRSIRELLKKYRSVPMDFADACLVAMAERLGSGRILTLDGDFNVYRWRKIRKFELLIDLDA